MPSRQIQHCLETFRMVLAWGMRADVRKLPPDYVLPIDNELIGYAKSKDPLRQVPVSLEKRIELIGLMDRWQLLTLGPLMVLPLRFEDPAGMLISDLDLAAKTLKLGTRLGGADFNKGQVEVTMPLPDELIPLFSFSVAGRAEGPLFLSRMAIRDPQRFQIECEDTYALEAELQQHFTAKSASICCDQDRKRVYREMLHQQMGAVSASRVGKELKSLFNRTGLDKCPPYGIRGSVTTEMKASGMQLLELRYLTEHTVNDILNEYATLDPFTAMASYFARIKPLLSAITNRAQELKITDPALASKSTTNKIVKPRASMVRKA
ncbi:hypothetical protein [Planctomicrobium piriforme]|nr:hypothetical protein [Planctomicrobium piriforme]